jgi:DNA-binding helix-hairpin-helix protein with protein kinase domain
VYEVAFDPAVVAKIYHQPPEAKKAEKLLTMVQLATPELLKFSAWPVSVLSKSSKIVGLLMPKMSREDRPIHKMYTPKDRLREFPSADWLFLIHVAANIARGFAAIHRAGHVIGDVNHGNVLVSSNGTTAFIDCDSFQIKSDGQLFRCEVGVPPYTPPELQNRAFGLIERTQNHDAFGLAVLLFQLLFMGRHPFAGRFSGRGDMPIERAIAEFRFAFGYMAAKMQMSPPPNSLLLDEVPSPMAVAFERAFGTDSSRGLARPTAIEWLAILEQLKNELARCKKNRAHVYFSYLSSCPWCEFEDRGIIFFLGVGVAVTPGLDIDGLWQRILRLPPLGTVPPIPTPANLRLNPAPSPESQSIGRSRRLRIGLGVAILFLTIWIVMASPLNGFISLCIIAGAIFLATKLPQGFQRQKEVLKQNAQNCQLAYRELQNRYAAECGEQPVAAKIQEIDQMRREYKGLPLDRQRKLQELEQNKRAIQLHSFLDQYSIQDAKIPDIGAGRKQMLASFGVDSAADVTAARVFQVPGIGPKRAQRLFDWRLKLEGKFRFDPNKAIDRTELEKVDREIGLRRTQLEQKINRSVQDAFVLHANIATRSIRLFEADGIRGSPARAS